METILLALAGPGAAAVVFGACFVWDRLREPYRRLDRPVVVVDRRTYRDAQRRIERLIEQGDWRRAHHAAIAITTWLSGEKHYGSRRRQRWFAAELERWQARRAELDPKVLL